MSGVIQKSGSRLSLAISGRACRRGDRARTKDQTM